MNENIWKWYRSSLENALNIHWTSIEHPTSMDHPLDFGLPYFFLQQSHVSFPQIARLAQDRVLAAAFLEPLGGRTRAEVIPKIGKIDEICIGYKVRKALWIFGVVLRNTVSCTTLYYYFCDTVCQYVHVCKHCTTSYCFMKVVRLGTIPANCHQRDGDLLTRVKLLKGNQCVNNIHPQNVIIIIIISIIIIIIIIIIFILILFLLNQSWGWGGWLILLVITGLVITALTKRRCESKTHSVLWSCSHILQIEMNIYSWVLSPFYCQTQRYCWLFISSWKQCNYN